MSDLLDFVKQFAIALEVKEQQDKEIEVAFCKRLDAIGDYLDGLLPHFGSLAEK